MRNRHWQIGTQVLTLVLVLGALAGVGNSLPAALAQDELFVTSYLNSSITVYSRTAGGNAAPLRTLGSATGLKFPWGVATDPVNNELVVANVGNNSITVYSRTASGNATPLRTLSGPATGLSWPGSVAVDTLNNELVVANFRNNSITVYSRTASGNATPLRTLQVTNPQRLAVDTQHNELFV